LRLLYDWLCLFLTVVAHAPDLVHINPGLDGRRLRSFRRDAVNVLIARLLRRRVLLFWRGWDNAWCGAPEFPKGNRSLLARVYRSADAHIVLASQFRDDLRRWGVRAPIHVETAVVGDELLAEPPRNHEGLAPGHRLLFLSRVEEAKGVFELVEAYRLLKAENSAYTLTIAGDGQDLEALRRHAGRLGLEDIRFTGFVEGPAKMQCFREADVFCFLSYTEGMPNAVLEAMAMGLPLVSSNAGGLRDILQDGETGFIVRQDPVAPARGRFDPHEVAQKIRKLATDRVLYLRISRHNRELAHDRFAAPKVARRLEAIYASVLNPSSS
jgi:glycosyltransferase involved in cell wall biosynthesis